jgi:hypothetical protein
MITAPGPKPGDQINSRQSILRPGPPSQTARHSAEQRRYPPPLGAARANLQPNFRSGDHASGGRHAPPGKTLPTNPHKPRTRACFTRVLSLEAFRRGPEPTRQRRPISEQGPASETLHRRRHSRAQGPGVDLKIRDLSQASMKRPTPSDSRFAVELSNE